MAINIGVPQKLAEGGQATGEGEQATGVQEAEAQVPPESLPESLPKSMTENLERPLASSEAPSDNTTPVTPPAVSETLGENIMRPRLVIIGIGGAGGNAVNNMIDGRMDGVEYLALNTDAQALSGSQASNRIQIGVEETAGLGAGARPAVGQKAAEETIEEVMGFLNGTNMIFIAAGMGGGTGTGAAPIIAKEARARGILCVGVVTKPFHFEGTHRMKVAEAGINDLEKHVDTLIVIPNQNLFRIANEQTTFEDAFRLADNVLYSGVRGITDLMTRPGHINLDFADISSVMNEMGKAMMGTGEADGERRALDAAGAAIANPLLDDISMKGARAVLINITGGNDMTLFEVDEAANHIRSEVDDDEAYIIFGSSIDETMNGRVRVSVVATGIGTDPVGGGGVSALTHEGSHGATESRIIHRIGEDELTVASAENAMDPVPTDTPTTDPAIDSTQTPADPSHTQQPISEQDTVTAEHPPAAHKPEAPPSGTPGRDVRDAFIPGLATDTPSDTPSDAGSPDAGSPAQLFEETPATDIQSTTPTPPASLAEPVPAPAITPEPAPMPAPMPVPAPENNKNSLFGRITSVVKRQQPAQEPQSVAPEPAHQVAQVVAPHAALSPLAPAEECADEAEEPAGLLQKGNTASEDDLLDIPAFLRKQAN